MADSEAGGGGGAHIDEATGILIPEYEREAVPLSARRPRKSVIMVWLGFPMVISGAALGASLTLAMGYKSAVLGIILGNLFLLFYVGFQSQLAQKSGYNFAMLCRTTFGSRGFAIASGLLATLVIGWFTVQTALVAVYVNGSFGWNLPLWAAIAGILYTVVAVVGIRGLTWIGAVSAPLFVIFGVWAVIDAASQSTGSQMWNYGGDPTVSGVALGVAVTLVAAFFIDSGTMTPDFTRWAKTRTDAWLSSGSGFPIGCGFAMLIGATVAAAAPTQGDMFLWLAGKGGIIAALATIFMFINLGSVCSHCLYNAAVGWAHLTHQKYRIFAIAFGIVGTGIAMTNAWQYFINWLIFLGIIVPPIGAVILADHFLPWSRHAGHDPFDIKGIAFLRLAPFVSWVIGSVVSLTCHYWYSQASEVVTGFVATFVVYAIIGRIGGAMEMGVPKTAVQQETST